MWVRTVSLTDVHSWISQCEPAVVLYQYNGPHAAPFLKFSFQFSLLNFGTEQHENVTKLVIEKTFFINLFSWSLSFNNLFIFSPFFKTLSSLQGKGSFKFASARNWTSSFSTKSGLRAHHLENAEENWMTISLIVMFGQSLLQLTMTKVIEIKNNLVDVCGLISVNP